ncbi:unnamed protein product [Cladocopium goreaui]|uniref:Poly [ADP-ribose] polymerase n=1 Tax=Cladocopium goreaui TaxID=2562237 RepID=A0A9P1FW90_9DINO|nr:unnamed protein product [Cladocopium goreaui]|mmetsp:Transcript_75917/g.167535  ORF Transcript_75917/g.167535 Transcript_75917/m.167535 type:complete len:206 (-) Transcript_75917:51-668(-)
MGSAAASARRLAGSTSVRGGVLCDDLELQELLKGWERLGVSFSGAILQAEHKETVKEYDMNHDAWTATDTILGENQLVIKTTGDGLLTLRLCESAGFKWEHIGTYRLGGKGKDGQSMLKVVDSSTKGFAVDDLRYALEQLRYVKYGKASGCISYQEFALRLFETLAGRPCEGQRDLDPLKGVEHGVNKPSKPASTNTGWNWQSGA